MYSKNGIIDFVTKFIAQESADNKNSNSKLWENK